MRDPNIVNAYEFAERAHEVHCGLPDGRWVPARSLGFSSILYRIRATWLVWTGRADALIWPGQEHD